MKLVQWGSGEQHPPQLFNLTADPDEWHNLALKTSLEHAHYAPLLADLDALLKSKVDYPEVAKDVARYNIQMARWWTQTDFPVLMLISLPCGARGRDTQCCRRT